MKSKKERKISKNDISKPLGDLKHMAHIGSRYIIPHLITQFKGKSDLYLIFAIGLYYIIKSNITRGGILFTYI